MNLKKIYIYLLILCSISFNFIISDEFDDAIDEVTSSADASQEIVRQNKEITYIDTLNNILFAKINNVLANDLYKKTHTVIKRPVNTLPIFNLYHTDHICQDWLFRFFLFGSITNRAFYTDSSPLIGSYLDISNKDILDVINTHFPKGTKVIELAKNTKKQERRAGIMFQTLMNFDDLSFEIDLPLFYEERNYFFTQREKEELEELFGKPPKDQEKEFQKLAVSDKFGFGDARVKLGYSVIQKNNICVKVGLQSTLPIAFALKKGIVGSDFKKVTQKPTPPFDFKHIFELEQRKEFEKLGEEFKEFGMTALDWLSAMVLDDPLGNSGHFGLGIFVEPQIKLYEAVSLKALSSVEYFFTKKENRFFLKKKNKENFKTSTLEKDLDNEEDAKKAVMFLNHEVIETIFPPVFCADVTPGFIAQITIGPQFKLNEWNFAFGYDFWFQDREKIGNVFFKNPCHLEIDKATKNRASTSKLFATLSYNKIKPDKDWSFILSFEDAIVSSGVGKDLSVAAGFEFNY